MPKRIHLIAGILSPLLIATFFTATVLVELTGSHAAVAQLKALIVTPGLWVLMPCLAATGGSGMLIGKTRKGWLVEGKKKRMLAEYFPILLFILVGLLVGVGPVVLGSLLGPHRPDPEKLSPYECGFEAFEDARMKFDVRYYLVAILFILFDLEIAFLFPWAVVINDIGLAGFLAMMLFLGILVVGFIYEWMKGALEWE